MSEPPEPKPYPSWLLKAMLDNRIPTADDFREHIARLDRERQLLVRMLKMMHGEEVK